MLFPEPTGLSPFEITRGPDGNLWFTVQDIATNSGKIGKIDYTGAITEYTVPGESLPWDITSGHDGKLWFASNEFHFVGSVTTSGSFTIYAVPALGPIVAGPQGAVWFATTTGLGKISPAGKITSFPLSVTPFEIASGPDGDIWFTVENGNGGMIGKMTTSGVVTEYAVPGNLGVGITSGPDKNIWVLMANGPSPGSILRVTTAGAVTEFPLPGQVGGDRYEERIISGPGGALWYTRDGENSIQYVGQITTAGQITEHKYPAANQFESSLGGIAGGLDGNLWFTQSNGSGSVNVFIRRVLAVFPSTIMFSMIDQSRTISISETLYAGPWTATTSDSTVATVRRGPMSNLFVVTAAGSGNATISVSDSTNNSFAVPVSVP